MTEDIKVLWDNVLFLICMIEQRDVEQYLIDELREDLKRIREEYEISDSTGKKNENY